LALVAEENGLMVGHVMLTRTFFLNDRTRCSSLLLAPLSVKLEFRNRGIGSLLVRRGLDLARARGHQSVFLVGDPAYYSRFGFKASTHWNIKNTSGIPDEVVQACELVPDALKGLAGTIEFEH
jgi:predicted N-acetyltransferase YhbS